MNKQAILAWADALESGLYAEIPYPMHTESGFDRFGVLTEAYRLRSGGEWVPAKCWCPELAASFLPRFEFLGSSFWPPDEVIAWLGIRCTCGAGSELTHRDHCAAQRPYLAFGLGPGSKLDFREAALRLRAL